MIYLILSDRLTGELYGLLKQNIRSDLETGSRTSGATLALPYGAGATNLPVETHICTADRSSHIWISVISADNLNVERLPTTRTWSCPRPKFPSLYPLPLRETTCPEPPYLSSPEGYSTTFKLQATSLMIMTLFRLASNA
jgi:hypothetical protein